MEDVKKTPARKMRHAVFLAALCFLIPFPSAGAGFAIKDCFNVFRSIPGFRPSQRAPSDIREIQKIAGLTDQEIKGSVIVSAGGAFSKFVVYAKREMEAEKVLILDWFNTEDTPDHFFMHTHPLLGLHNATAGAIPFHPSIVRQRLGGRFADITLSLSSFGKFNLGDTRLWLEQMIKITRPGGLVILDLGKHGGEKIQQVTSAEFQDILSQMKTSGVISDWSAQHINHRFPGLNPVSFDPSVTYRIVTSARPSPGDEFKRRIQNESRGHVIQFPHKTPSREE